MPTSDQVFKKIDTLIEPFRGYKESLAKLAGNPPGYAYCFAFTYVRADILNGGISQLYGNSTWCLVPDAIKAAEAAAEPKVAQVLREMVYYYHRKGRSKLSRRMSDDDFKSIRKTWNKSLGDLDEEFLALAGRVKKVVDKLCKSQPHLFESN